MKETEKEKGIKMKNIDEGIKEKIIKEKETKEKSSKEEEEEKETEKRRTCMYSWIYFISRNQNKK